MLPPRVASVQVIVIPIRNSKSSQEDSDALTSKAESIVKDLKAQGVRVKSDLRDIYTPGWKYNHWETKVHNLQPPAVSPGSYQTFCTFP